MRELELLERLIAFPTVSDQSNQDLIDWAEAVLKHAGFKTTQLPSETQGKSRLYASFGPKMQGGLCLSAHTDVVPVAGQAWSRDPFKLTRDGPNLYGRGTTDMKGFVACALAAAERAAHSKMNKPFSIVLSYDEEIGCVGIREMMPKLKKLIGQPELVVVGEPTSLDIAIGHKGKVAMKVTCHGEAGHSAIAPRYRNAIHLAARFVEEVRQLQANLAEGAQDPAYDIPYSTVHIGKINGGRALNIVPDATTLEMEIRYLAQAPMHDLMALVRDIANLVCENEGCKDAISIEPLASYPCLDMDASSEAVTKVQAIEGRDRVVKVPFGTEAGFFAELGLDAVVFGPGDMEANGHKPDEHIAVAELERCASALDRMLLRLTQ